MKLLINRFIKRLALITAGNGASTAFAFGEEVIADLFQETFEP